MVSDKKYKFATAVFRIISPCPLKERAPFEAFRVEDGAKEDYLYEICPVQAEQVPPVQVKREGNSFKISIRESLLPEITIANLFSAAQTANLFPERNEFVLHASYVVDQGKAILFCAPSGTGKSTQANYWNLARNTITVNENRAIVFRQNGMFYAGGCWATGKASTCRNISVPIRGIVLLEQDAENTVVNLPLAEKVKRIIAQCSFEAENMQMQESIMGNILDLIAAVPVIGYACVNDISAVEELEKHL